MLTLQFISVQKRSVGNLKVEFCKLFSTKALKPIRISNAFGVLYQHPENVIDAVVCNSTRNKISTARRESHDQSEKCQIVQVEEPGLENLESQALSKATTSIHCFYTDVK